MFVPPKKIYIHGIGGAAPQIPGLAGGPPGAQRLIIPPWGGMALPPFACHGTRGPSSNSIQYDTTLSIDFQSIIQNIFQFSLISRF